MVYFIETQFENHLLVYRKLRPSLPFFLLFKRVLVISGFFVVMSGQYEGIVLI